MMKSETIEAFLTKLQTLFADPCTQDDQMELHLHRLEEQLRQVYQFLGKEPPIGGRKYYLLTRLSRLSLDCTFLYRMLSSLEQLRRSLEYWQSEPLPGLLRSGTTWEFVIMQMLQVETSVYRLSHTSVAGTEYAWKSLMCNALMDLLKAIDQCAMLLGSDLEERLQRSVDELPVIPPSMQLLGTGLLSWLFLHRERGLQKRIILLEGVDGNFVSLSLPEGGAYGQVYALVCEERNHAFAGSELPGVPYEQPLLLGEGRVGYELEVSPLPHACWLLADDGTTDPWNQDALHRVDYRYSHLLFMPLVEHLPDPATTSQNEGNLTWFIFDVTARGQVSVVSKNRDEARSLIKDNIVNLTCDDPAVPVLDLHVDDCWEA